MNRRLALTSMLIATILAAAVAIWLAIRLSTTNDEVFTADIAVDQEPATRPAMSDIAGKLVAGMPSGWKMTGYGRGSFPHRWSIDPDIDPNDCESLSFTHETARAGGPPGPATVKLLIAPAGYVGRLYETISASGSGPALGWVGQKHLLFGGVSTKRRQDAAPVAALIESLGFRKSTVYHITPAAARVVKSVKVLSAADKKKALPSNGAFVPRAVKGGQSGRFVFTVLARAASEPLVIPHRSGTAYVSQRFQFIESIRGTADTRYPYPVNYMIRTKTERPIIKGEQAIAVVNIDDGQLFVAKALADTPKNRKSLKAAADTIEKINQTPASKPGPAR